MKRRKCGSEDPDLSFARRLTAALPGVLVYEFSSRVVRQWCALVESKAGIWGWGRSIPYTRDEAIGSGASFEDQQFAEWATPQNQHALMHACDSTVLSENPGVLIDADISEASIEPVVGRDLGDRNLDVLADQLTELLETGVLGWVIVPLGADTEYCLVACRHEGRDLVEKMARFCDASGIVSKLAIENQTR